MLTTTCLITLYHLKSLLLLLLLFYLLLLLLLLLLFKNIIVEMWLLRHFLKPDLLDFKWKCLLTCCGLHGNMVSLTTGKSNIVVCF